MVPVTRDQHLRRRSNISRPHIADRSALGSALDRSGRLAALLNTIARTGTVLGLFTAETPEWGVTEVATILGLPKSTAFDLLASLAEIGLLQQTSNDRYRLGWQLLVISRRLMNSICCQCSNSTHRRRARPAPECDRHHRSLRRPRGRLHCARVRSPGPDQSWPRVLACQATPRLLGSFSSLNCPGRRCKNESSSMACPR